MITDTQITKFQEIYKLRFSKEITRQEAYRQGVKLMRLVEIIYQPITIKEYENVQKRREKYEKEN